MLCMDHKGLNCELCGQFWCDDYSAQFVYLERHPKYEDNDDWPDMCCPRCFFTDENMHCTEAGCGCGYDLESINKVYDAHRLRGYFAGQVDLEKEGSVWMLMLYGYRKEERVRMELTTKEPTEKEKKVVEFHMANLETALIDAQRLVDDALKLGFLKPEKRSYLDVNPWGKFDDIRLTLSN